MNNSEKERFKKICYNTNYNKEYDCSGLKTDNNGNAIIKPMTTAQQLKVYKKLGKEPPAHLKPKSNLKLLKSKAGNG